MSKRKPDFNVGILSFTNKPIAGFAFYQDKKLVSRLFKSS